MLAVGDCSGEACPVPGGALAYGASPAGNVFMLAAFAALILPNLYTGVRYKTPIHTTLVVAALLVEVIGHVGKILLGRNPASHAYSTVYLLGTHWGSILLGSAIYLALPHALVIYGQEFRVVSDPIYVNISFFALDVFTLAFQSVGIGFASNASGASEISHGLSILLVGLAIQAVSIVGFLATYRYFRHKLSHRRYILDDTFSAVFLSRRYKSFMVGIQIVAGLLLLRTAVRIAIFANGLASALARSQVASFILDDTLLLLAALILTIHPAGRAFGFAWAATSPFTPSHRPGNLPLQFRRRHRRNRSSQVTKHVISLPFSSPASSPRFSPRAGAPTGLPAHPSPRAQNPEPPLMSPQNNPVHQRSPYEMSPTQTMPFLPPQESPGLDAVSAMWATPTTIEHGRRRQMWAGPASPEVNRMVDGDALWN